MATKTTTTSESVSIGIDQSNGKTRYITVPNPSGSIEAHDVETAMANFFTNGILLDEVTGNAITDTAMLSTAYTTYSTIVTAEF